MKTIPVLHTHRVSCPDCGSFRLATRSSRENGDGSKTAYVKCECGRTMYVVEDPNLGRDENFIVQQNCRSGKGIRVPHDESPTP